MLRRHVVILAVILCLLSSCAASPPPPSQASAPSSEPTSAAVLETPSLPSSTTTAASPSVPVATETPVAAIEPSVPATVETETAGTVTQEFAFISSDGHLQVASLDGKTRTVWDRGEVTGIAWAPDGEQLAFVADGVLYIWTVTTNAANVVLQQPVSIGEPSWSADGAYIAITASENNATECYDDSPCSILLINSTTGQTQTLGLGRNPVFAPTGRALLAATLPPLSPQMREGEWSAPIVWPSFDTAPITVSDAVNTAAWTRAGWSADGTVAAANNAVLDASGVVVDRIAEVSGEVVNEDAPTIANGLAPDGQSIALATLTITTTDDGFVSDTTLSLHNRITQQRRNVWRYDETIVLNSVSQPAVLIANTSRGSMTGHGRVWRVSPVAWSPNGQMLAFTGCGRSLADDRESGCGLWLAAGDGSNLRLVDNTSGTEGVEQSLYKPLFAPDGSAILFLHFNRANDEPFSILALPMTVDGAAQRIVNGKGAQWRPSSGR